MGILVHQGQQYGTINRCLMLAGCIAIVVLAISAKGMWWKCGPNGWFGRRPAAHLPIYNTSRHSVDQLSISETQLVFCFPASP